MVADSNLDKVSHNYRLLLAEHGEGPAVAQLSSEGQLSRFKKLSEVGDLTGKSVLDVGCGLGDLLPFLRQRFEGVSYTGVDIVPELIGTARQRRGNDGTFFCHDLVAQRLDRKFDFVLISGIFNNVEIPDTTNFLKQMTVAAFEHCVHALAFNFISTQVNFTDPRMAYHDPRDIFAFCLERLSPRVVMCHHYDRCDVAVFVYR